VTLRVGDGTARMYPRAGRSTPAPDTRLPRPRPRVPVADTGVDQPLDSEADWPSVPVTFARSAQALASRAEPSGEADTWYLADVWDGRFIVPPASEAAAARPDAARNRAGRSSPAPTRRCSSPQVRGTRPFGRRSARRSRGRSRRPAPQRIWGCLAARTRSGLPCAAAITRTRISLSWLRKPPTELELPLHSGGSRG
jgi:hypothetical protein